MLVSLKMYNSFNKNMLEESLNWYFRVKNIDKARTYLVKEKDQNEFTSNKVCTTLNYI